MATNATLFIYYVIEVRIRRKWCNMILFKDAWGKDVGLRNIAKRIVCPRHINIQ